MKRLVVATTLCVASVGYAGDWTPYLKDNDIGCKPESFAYLSGEENPKAAFIKELPKSLRGDVVSVDGDNYEKTVYLKNATLLGYPITKIVFDAAMTFSGRNQTIIHFKETPTKALSKFGITQKPYAIVSVTKGDKTVFKKRVAKSPKGDYSRYFKPYKGDAYFKSVFIADQSGWGSYGVDMELGGNAPITSVEYDKNKKTITCAVIPT